MGGNAGGHRRTGDGRRAPALRGPLAPSLQRGSARVTDGDPSQSPSPGPSAEPPPVRPPPPADAAGNGAKAPEEMSVGELVFEVSDRASGLIREEIELA